MAYLSMLWEPVQIQARIRFWSMPSHRFHSTGKFHPIFAVYAHEYD